MKTYETRERSITEECLISHTCDLCGGKMRYGDGWFDVGEVEISCQIGSRYPEGGNYDIVETDCCVDCFDDRVKPALEALGAKFRDRQFDY